MILGAGLLLSGCEGGPKAGTKESSFQKSPTSLGECQSGEVSIEGYGDKAKRLKNCFVEYPGEPTRQDKSYYIVEDICGQFTKELIGNSLGKNIIKTKAPEAWSVYSCSYYWSEKDYVQLVLDYLKIGNQKKFWEEEGKKVEEDSRIPIKNLVVQNKDGSLGTLYWVLGEDKFISLHRSTTANLSNDEIINFAIKIGEVIKNYK